jgi:hypothetical protein
MVFDREADTEGGGTQDEEILNALFIFHPMSDADPEGPLTILTQNMLIGVEP